MSGMMPMLFCLLALLAPTTEPSAFPPIYQMSPRQIDAQIDAWRREVPALNDRVVAIARRNLGQPYELYLLGEAPFETIDAQPIYCIERSDCVVFVEHTLAMALSSNFPEFLRMLQRIRYNGGRIGVLTRNHYTEADWNVNNRWLLREITTEIAGADAAVFKQRVDRAKFFRDRYKLDAPFAVQDTVEPYIPFDRIPGVLSQLRNGDVVNFVTARGESGWVGHVGLVAVADNGAVTLIHSAAPRVREEPIEDYIKRATSDRAQKLAEGKAAFAGFKFLRLNDDPLAQLKKLDGPAAPVVWLPAGSAITWDQFVNSAFPAGGDGGGAHSPE